MNAPLDHHFIPAFFLAQWTDANGKLIEYTKKAGKVIAKSVGPRATGFERELYSFPELPAEAAQFIEQKFFDYADRVAAVALQVHLNGKTAQAWPIELRSAWSRFVVALHFRHPDAMPEFRAAAKSVWDGSGAKYQKDYEAIKKPEDPPTFDDYLAIRDPLAGNKMHVNLIIKIFDNDILGKHLNNMHWSVVDVSESNHRFLLSCRPVCFANLKEPSGVVYLAISPTRLFTAANDPAMLRRLRSLSPRELVHNQNRFVVGRARRFVWAHSKSQAAFITKHMSINLEPTPLFPGVGYHPDGPYAASN
jgi:hypothetical protein